MGGIDNEDEGSGIFPPICQRCRRLYSWIELIMETDPKLNAKMIDNQFICVDCLTESEKTNGSSDTKI